MAIEASGCDRHARALFKHATGGLYVGEEEHRRIRERLWTMSTGRGRWFEHNDGLDTDISEVHIEQEIFDAREDI
jgi:hypothetical protein